MPSVKTNFQQPARDTTANILVPRQKSVNPPDKTKFFTEAAKSMDSLARSLVHLGAVTK